MPKDEKKRTYKPKVPIGKLLPFEKNPRTMPHSEMRALERSIVNWGFVEPVVVDEAYLIIGGHQRVQAARNQGLKTVPVMMIEGLDEDEKVILNIALNKIHGRWEEYQLSELLNDLSKKAVDLDLTGFTKEEVDSLLSIAGEVPEFNPEKVEFMARLDKTKKVTCPKCGELLVFGADGKLKGA